MDDSEYSDEEILRIVRDERQRSLGFDDNLPSGELQAERLKALRYYKRDMRDIPVLENRSAATSSDLADAVKQILPQVVEIFLDEDVAAFRPMNAQDIDAAQQITDYINHVIFKDNNGFLLLYLTFWNALMLKVGYWTWKWEEPKEPESQDFEGMSQEDFINAFIAAQTNQATIANLEAQPDGTFNYTLVDPQRDGRCVIEAWPPEDVAHSEDTSEIGEGSYCAFRSRQRRDQLIVDGYDPDVVAELPIYGDVPTETLMERGQAGEYEAGFGGSTTPGMDTVQVVYHYVRVRDGDRMRIMRVTTGGDSEAILLRREWVRSVPAAGVTPSPIPGVHLGESLADMLVEVQAIRTSILRMGLDSGYFALNGRAEISEDGSSKHTLTDFYDNIPGTAIRSKTGDAVRPIQTGSLWDWGSALETMSTIGQERSGVLRSTMGVDATSLHETKGGMLSMMNMGQTRVRFMARIFADTGFKKLVLGVYDCIRSNASMQAEVNVAGKFVPIDPTSWGAREHIDVDICNGGGRDYDLNGLQQLIGVFKDTIQIQGGVNGPIVTAPATTYLLRAFAKRLGRRDSDMLFPDPSEVQQMMQAQQPKPDPDTMKAQAQAQAQQAQLQLQSQKQQAENQLAQNQQQFDQAHAAAKMQADQARSEAEIRLKQWQAQQDVALQQRKIDQEAETKRQQIQQELALKAGEISTQAQLDAAAIHTDAALGAHKAALHHDIEQQKVDAVPLAEVEPGGEGG
jgi:hypothetical protein